ncbi:peptidase domain-containing ABC transporter [Idiomarina loihiensis]|uniref:peptidase domain-containing ABC transporter n=1 Tax=Idiomarina loihiensis TaxID=135577 RepID=UPI00384E4B0E
MVIVYQSEAAECGLASIAMVSNHYGHKIDLQTLRSRYSVSLTGANLQQIMGLGEQLGLAGRALKLELDELHKLSLPCILHWDMNHFVVLKKVSRKSITILDPARGERKVSMEDADKSFTGIALELTPTSNFKKQDDRVRLKLSSFWTRVRGLVPSLIKLFILSLLLQIFMLAAPYYTQTVVDEVIVSYDQPLLVVLALGFGLLVLMRVVTNALRGWVVLHLGAVMSVQMGVNLFRHLIHLPLSYFEKRHMGDVVSRFGSLNQVRELFTNNLIESIIDGLMAIVVLVVMFLYSSTLAFVVIGVTLIYALSRALLYRPLQDRNEAAIMAEAKEQSNFMETVRGMQTIKLFGHQVPRLNLWQNRYADTVNEIYRLGQWEVSYQTINQLLFGIENIVVVYLAALYVMEGDLTVGMLFAFMSYKGQFTERMAGLIDRLVEVKMVRLHLDRLSDIALTDKEDEGASAYHREIEGTLKLDKISFRYAMNDPMLFDGLELSVEKGESVAIIGPSGNGKTTLMKIMLGLLQPSSGKIEVDGVDITHIGLRNYRQQIAAVMQDDQLMSGSIAENISFFDTKLDMERVVNCAQMAGIHQDISSMQMGYNALIGDMGSTLSGGQKQRVLLARALYRQPKILFMDEATSHLDVQLEHHVNHAIKQQNMTRIIIAHRPETILNADRIIQLHGGRLEDITEEYKAQFRL